MLEMARDLLSWAFILGGGFFLIVGGIGLLRLPDFFTRLHAAGIIDTMGAELMLAGFVLQAGFSLVTVKLLLIVLFIMFTSPTAAHALAKAALHGGYKPRLATGGDDDRGSD